MESQKNCLPWASKDKSNNLKLIFLSMLHHPVCVNDSLLYIELIIYLKFFWDII